MPKISITEETRNKAIRLYKNKNLTRQEISNLTSLSVANLAKIFREEYKMGTLKPRRNDLALKKLVLNPAMKGKHGGQNKTYTEEQDRQIAKEYYDLGMTCAQIMEKWNLHPQQLQRIRELYGKDRERKQPGKAREILQFDKQGNFIAQFDNGHKASIELGISYANINSCLNGRLKSAGGYIWRFKEKENDNTTT